MFRMTKDLETFLDSEWGQKTILAAFHLGSRTFEFAKKKYDTRDLKQHIDLIKNKPQVHLSDNI